MTSDELARLRELLVLYAMDARLERHSDAEDAIVALYTAAAEERDSVVAAFESCNRARAHAEDECATLRAEVERLRGERSGLVCPCCGQRRCCEFDDDDEGDAKARDGGGRG